MKKLGISLLLALILLTGCGKKEVKPEIRFQDNYYKVYEPFKIGVSENYVVDSTTRYDLMEVDSVLMDLSLSYFPANNSLYQSGQYLTKEILQTLLDTNHLNKNEPLVINNQNITHNYISYIHEQNYLSSNGNLKGISLAIALNPYVQYSLPDGSKTYQEIPEDQLVQFGKQAANQLLKELYAMDGLNGMRIVIGLFIQASPNSTDLGQFKYIGETTKNTITFSPISYQTVYLTSNYVMNNDLQNYNNFQNLNNTLTQQFSDLAISGKGIYVNQKIKSATITINTIVKSRGELMAINQQVAELLSTSYSGETSVTVYVKFNKDIVSMITKQQNSNQANIYLIEE